MNKFYLGISYIVVTIVTAVVTNFIIKKNNSDKKIYSETPAIIDCTNESLKTLARASFAIDAIKLGINTIAKRSSTLQEGTVKQNKYLNNIETVVDDVYRASKETYENAMQLSEDANRTYESVKEKKNDISKTVDNFNQLNNKLKATIEASNSLSQKSIEAQKLVGAIENISEQTNILAINASVEAARAGEAGKGFAIVAHEVRRLAVQTANVSKSIVDMIKEIEDISNVTTIEMQSAATEIVRQSEQLSLAIEDLNQIENETERFSVENAQMANETHELASKIEQVKALTNDISIIGEENSESTHDVNESIQEQAKGFNLINDSMNDLEGKLITSLVKMPKSHNADELILKTSPYPPFVIEDKNGLTGIDVELVKEAFRRDGINVKAEVATWDGCLEMLRLGLNDIVPAFSYDASRDSYVDFSTPYRDECHFVFYTCKDSNVSINHYEDLNKYRIGIQDYIYNERFMNDSHIIKEMNGSDNDAFFKNLLKGQIDALIINEYIGAYYLNQNPSLAKSFEKQPFCFKESGMDNLLAFSKHNKLQAYSDIFTRNIAAMKKDGTYKKIEDKFLK